MNKWQKSVIAGLNQGMGVVMGWKTRSGKNWYFLHEPSPGAFLLYKGDSGGRGVPDDSQVPVGHFKSPREALAGIGQREAALNKLGIKEGRAMETNNEFERIAKSETAQMVQTILGGGVPPAPANSVQTDRTEADLLESLARAYRAVQEGNSLKESEAPLHETDSRMYGDDAVVEPMKGGKGKPKPKPCKGKDCNKKPRPFMGYEETMHESASEKREAIQCMNSWKKSIKMVEDHIKFLQDKRLGMMKDRMNTAQKKMEEGDHGWVCRNLYMDGSPLE
jgi:hypothetical protein